MTANVNKCVVLVCSEDENIVTFKSKWGKDELPIVDQYMNLVEICKDCSWGARIARVLRRGKLHVGEMGAITRIEKTSWTGQSSLKSYLVNHCKSVYTIVVTNPDTPVLVQNKTVYENSSLFFRLDRSESCYPIRHP